MNQNPPSPTQAEALAKIGGPKTWRCGSKYVKPSSLRYIGLPLVRQLAARGWLFHTRYLSPADWHILSDKEMRGMKLVLSAKGRAALNHWRREHGLN